VSGVVVIDLSKIESKDIEDKGTAAKLDGHLKGADFFEVDKYPVATYTADKISRNKDGSYLLKGKLKIKDVEQPQDVTLKEVTEGGTKYLSGAFKFDRTKFNVKYNSSAFFSLAKLGDKVIKDEVDMELKLALK
jgi:polyisoprenoid-binding protein YceI